MTSHQVPSRIVHNICQSFRKSGLSETFHAPSRLPADKISTWTPTTLYVGRRGTIAHKTFPASPLGQSNGTAVPSLKIRTSEPSCQRCQARHLFCHCLAHEECHADVLARAYESEVMTLPEVFTPATLQRNDASLVTEPHGFSRSAGGGVHSSGEWLVPRAGIRDIFKDLRHAIVEIVSRHGLHNAASAAWAARSRSPSM